MHWFRYGTDFYSGAWLPEQLAWHIGVAFLFIVLGLVGLHFFRRGLDAPEPEAEPPAALPPSAAKTFERIELGGRLYHWANLAVFIGLFLSAFAIYFPGIVPGVGVTWLWVHVVCAWVFVAFVILHIFFAFLWARPSDMWSFGRRDWRDLRKMASYYVGRTRQYPHTGKFDVWQKLYHAVLTLLALVMIGTGITLFIDAMILTTVGPNFLRTNRLIHDIGAWVFFGVIAGHVYVRLLRLNWSRFAGMITGRLSRDEFARWYDWSRWKPPPVESKTVQAQVPGED